MTPMVLVTFDRKLEAAAWGTYPNSLAIFLIRFEVSLPMSLSVYTLSRSYLGGTNERIWLWTERQFRASLFCCAKESGGRARPPKDTLKV